MTSEELRSYFNNVFGIEKEWPKTFEVDDETYENCLAEVEDWEEKQDVIFTTKENFGKLMFKGVELIRSPKK